MKPFLITLLAAFAMLACSSDPVTEADLEGRTFAYDDLKAQPKIDNPEVQAMIDKANADMGGKFVPAFRFDKGGKGEATDMAPMKGMTLPLRWTLKGDTLYTEMDWIDGDPRSKEFHIVRDGDGFLLRGTMNDEYSLKPL